MLHFPHPPFWELRRQNGVPHPLNSNLWPLHYSCTGDFEPSLCLFTFLWIKVWSFRRRAFRGRKKVAKDPDHVPSPNLADMLCSFHNCLFYCPLVKPTIPAFDGISVARGFHMFVLHLPIIGKLVGLYNRHYSLWDALGRQPMPNCIFTNVGIIGTFPRISQFSIQQLRSARPWTKY